MLTQAKLKSVPHFLGLAKIILRWIRERLDRQDKTGKVSTLTEHTPKRSSLAQCKEKFVRVDSVPEKCSVHAKLKHVVLLSTVITHQNLFPRMPSLRRNYWNSILWGKSKRNYHLLRILPKGLLGFDLGPKRLKNINVYL